VLLKWLFVPVIEQGFTFFAKQQFPLSLLALVITPATAVMPPLASGMAVWAEWIAVVAVVAVTVPDR